MKKYLSFLLAPLFLSACATTTGVIGAVTSPAPITGNTTIDEKLWYGAEAFYNAPAAAYVSANSRGLLSPSIKGVLKPKLQYMHEVLLALRQAYKVGDASGFTTRYNELKTLRDAVAPLIPK